MSERDDRYAGNDPAASVAGAAGLPRTTGEFRAAPDISASTAEFRAFAAGQTQASGAGPAVDTGAWPEQPWAGDDSSSGSNRKVAIIVGVVVAIVIIAIIAAVGL
jgi:hypothetical protein